MTSEAQKKAVKKYDSANMAFQTVKLKRETLEEFRQLVQKNGDKVNTVIRRGIERYVEEHRPPDDSNTDTTGDPANKKPPE